MAFHVQTLALLLIATTGLGCTVSQGKTYRSEQWTQRPELGRVLVVVPAFSDSDAADASKKDEQIQAAVREALARLPGTTVLGEHPQVATPVSESEAIEAGRRSSADTVCIVTLGQFGGRYLLTLLPPGWDSRTSVQYSLRLLDVKSGRLLVDSVRERSAGGYLAVMTATYPDDLEADVASVLSMKD